MKGLKIGIWHEQEQVIHTEQSIQGLLYHQFAAASKYMAPNIHCNLGEADLLIVRRSGYAEEFEIKISTSDLQADLRKQRKHQQFLLRFRGENTRRYMMANKFSYVLSNEVKYRDFPFPPYAGIYIAHHGLRCIKPAEVIHKRKYRWERKIAASCGHRLVYYFSKEIFTEI